MNHYGHRALEFSRRHRPKAFAEITNPDEFFTAAGEEIQAEISQRRNEILGDQKQGESLEAYRLRSYQALSTAEELMLADHYLFRPETSEELEDDSDLSRYYETLAAINETTDTSTE